MAWHLAPLDSVPLVSRTTRGGVRRVTAAAVWKMGNPAAPKAAPLAMEESQCSEDYKDSRDSKLVVTSGCDTAPFDTQYT